MDIQVPLKAISENQVLLFTARSYPAMGMAGTYNISYSVATREFSGEGYSCDKHEVYKDYNKLFRQKYSRKSAKNEAEVDKLLETFFADHLKAACEQYGVIGLSYKNCSRFTRFSEKDMAEYWAKLNESNLELDQVTLGIMEAMYFCKDYTVEEEDDEYEAAPDTEPKCKIVARVFCNRLQELGTLNRLIDSGYEWRQLGQDIYYGVVGHGTGFSDREQIKGDKELIDDLYWAAKHFHFEVEKGDDNLVHLRVIFNGIECLV